MHRMHNTYTARSAMLPHARVAIKQEAYETGYPDSHPSAHLGD